MSYLYDKIRSWGTKIGSSAIKCLTREGVRDNYFLAGAPSQPVNVLDEYDLWNEERKREIILTLSGSKGEGTSVNSTA